MPTIFGLTLRIYAKTLFKMPNQQFCAAITVVYFKPFCLNIEFPFEDTL